MKTERSSVSRKGLSRRLSSAKVSGTGKSLVLKRGLSKYHRRLWSPAGFGSSLYCMLIRRRIEAVSRTPPQNNSKRDRDHPIMDKYSKDCENENDPRNQDLVGCPAHFPDYLSDLTSIFWSHLCINNGRETGIAKRDCWAGIRLLRSLSAFGWLAWSGRLLGSSVLHSAG